MPERLCGHRFVTTDPPSILKLNPIYFLRSGLRLLSPSLQQSSLTALVASTLVFHRFEASFVVKWASFPSEYLARLQDYRNTYPVSKTATLETRMSLSLTRKPPYPRHAYQQGRQAHIESVAVQRLGETTLATALEQSPHLLVYYCWRAARG